MTEAHIPHYIPRDNIQATARPLGELITSGEAVVNQDGGLSVGEQQILAPHQFRVCVNEEGGIDVLPRVSREVKE